MTTTPTSTNARRHDSLSTDDRASRQRDVIVIGGGAAGLSAALTLARARRDVVVIDAGTPRNAPAEGVHGFLTRDGIPPRELTRLGRLEVESYGGEILDGVATTVTRPDGGAKGPFTVTVSTPDGRELQVTGRRLIVASGLTDELPPIPNLAERWGRDVVHCPYCHGWEIRDRAIGILGTGPFAVQQALLFRQWSSRITFFLHEAPEPTDEQWDQLAARDITVVVGTVDSLRVEDDALTGVQLGSGHTIPVDALAVGVPARSNADVLHGLGIAAEADPAGVGTSVPHDPATGATTVPGVWVAGNVGDFRMQVVSSAASGVTAGAMVNMDLITDETAVAVAERRDPFSARSEAANTTRILGDRRHGLDLAPFEPTSDGFPPVIHPR
jgi:thioredoxin reductase